MYFIQTDVSGPLKTVSGMIRKVNHFKRVDIGTTLSDWQTEDLHRKRPFTMRSRAKGMAATRIRPHSRYEVMRSRKAQRRLARRAKRKTFIAASAIYRKWSTRPILRADMRTLLVRRLSDALHKLIVWK